MAIKVKAIERNVAFVKGEEKWAYVLQADLYSKLSDAKVIQEAAMRSGISRGVMKACWDAAGEVIRAWATEGHSVAVPGLGSMRFGLRSESVADVNDVSAKLITSRRVIFTPTSDIKKELADTAVSITCYNRKGEIVKRVTSGDDGDVEDPEDEDQQGTGNTQQGGGNTQQGTDNNTQQGGGSDTSTDNDTQQGGGEGSGETTRYTVTVTSDNPEQGTVTGGGSFEPGKRASVSATPNEGYEFERWSDGNTSVSRSFAVNQDMDLVAYFKPAV